MNLKTDITNAAISPKSATSDGQSVTARSVDEIIKADQYGKSIDAVAKRRPIKIQRFKKGSTI